MNCPTCGGDIFQFATVKFIVPFQRTIDTILDLISEDVSIVPQLNEYTNAYCQDCGRIFEVDTVQPA